MSRQDEKPRRHDSEYMEGVEGESMSFRAEGMLAYQIRDYCYRMQMPKRVLIREALHEYFKNRCITTR